MLHVLKEKFHIYILCEYQEHSSVQRFTITLFVKATFFSPLYVAVQLTSEKSNTTEIQKMLHVLKEKFHIYILCEYQEHSSVQRFTITLFVKATFFSLTTICGSSVNVRKK